MYDAFPSWARICRSTPTQPKALRRLGMVSFVVEAKKERLWKKGKKETMWSGLRNCVSLFYNTFMLSCLLAVFFFSSERFFMGLRAFTRGRERDGKRGFLSIFTRRAASHYFSIFFPLHRQYTQPKPEETLSIISHFLCISMENFSTEKLSNYLRIFELFLIRFDAGPLGVLVFGFFHVHLPWKFTFYEPKPVKMCLRLTLRPKKIRHQHHRIREDASDAFFFVSSHRFFSGFSQIIRTILNGAISFRHKKYL